MGKHDEDIEKHWTHMGKYGNIWEHIVEHTWEAIRNMGYGNKNDGY